MLEIFGAPISSITVFSFLEFNGISQRVFCITFNQKKIFKTFTAIQSLNTCNLKFSDYFH